MNLLKFNLNFNTFFYLAVFAFAFLLSACKPDDPIKIVDNIILDAQQTILFFDEFNYKGFVKDLSYRIKDIKKTRFPEVYTVNLSTYNNFDSIYNHIISSCSALSDCKVQNSNISDYGYDLGSEYEVSIVLPSGKASDFISKIIKGPDDIFMIDNLYYKDPIEADLIFYEMKLEALSLLKDSVLSAVDASSNDLNKISHIKNTSSDLNFEIASLKSTIDYLKNVQYMARIDFSVVKKFNSTASMLKNKTLLAFVKFSSFLDEILFVLFIIIVFKFSSWFFPWFAYFIKSSWRSFKRFINEKKNSKPVIKNNNDDAKPPYFKS